MKNIICLIFALLITFSSYSQTKWKPVTYSISFNIKHVAGATANGKFSGLKAEIKLDPEKTDNATLTATIESATFNTGNNSRDKVLKGKEYFDVINHPLISMKSLKINHIKGDNYEGIFKLTIKSVTKEIPLKFTFLRTGSQGIFKTEFSINRLDYGIGEKSWMLSNEAYVSIIVNTIKE